MCRIVKISGVHEESLLMWVQFQDDARETLLPMASTYDLVPVGLCWIHRIYKDFETFTSILH
jgi:hypothetical protein